MTEEQAIKILKKDKALCEFNPTTGEDEPISEDCRKSAEALDVVIKALEQQSSEDCVSRQAVLQMIEDIENAGGFIGYNTYSEAFDRVDNMPPVTPTFPKNATNGDAIKAMFPNMEVVRQEISSTSNNIIVRDDSFFGAINRFHTDWWNAPYTEKRGNENGSN